jgi:hypothetical protein
VRIETFADPPALLRGLSALHKQGLTPRGLLFLALDSRGTIYLATSPPVRVGEKLTLRWSGPPAYHFDSVHVVRDDFYVINGDRRLTHPGDAIEVGLVVANFLMWCQARNVFFGCTPHQPGSWLLGGKQVAALHDFGVVEVLPTGPGLLARRIHDHRLYLLTFADIARTGHLEDWLPVFASPLGNILLLERRVVRDLLVLSCERGLVEVDVSDLPRVREHARLPFAGAQKGPPAAPPTKSRPQPIYAVVGRLSGTGQAGGEEAFAVTRGTPRPWGLEDLQPAELFCAAAGQLSDIEEHLNRLSTETG